MYYFSMNSGSVFLVTFYRTLPINSFWTIILKHHQYFVFRSLWYSVYPLILIRKYEEKYVFIEVKLMYNKLHIFKVDEFGHKNRPVKPSSQ